MFDIVDINEKSSRIPDGADGGDAHRAGDAPHLRQPQPLKPCPCIAGLAATPLNSSNIPLPENPVPYLFSKSPLRSVLLSPKPSSRCVCKRIIFFTNSPSHEPHRPCSWRRRVRGWRRSPGSRNSSRATNATSSSRARRCAPRRSGAATLKPWSLLVSKALDQVARGGGGTGRWRARAPTWPRWSSPYPLNSRFSAFHLLNPRPVMPPDPRNSL